MSILVSLHNARVKLAFPRRVATLLWSGLLILSVLILAGCDQTGQMIDQPRYDPLQGTDFFADGSSARLPPAGSVPYLAEGSPADPALTGKDANGEALAKMPVQITQDLVGLGQERFSIYCVPCHGPAGEGNGKVTGFGFPKPPSLLSDQAKALTDGQIFGIITSGQGNMFPYAYRVKPNERWAVIAYIRAMQLKNGAVNAKDLTPEEINQLGSQP